MSRKRKQWRSRLGTRAAAEYWRFSMPVLVVVVLFMLWVLLLARV